MVDSSITNLPPTAATDSSEDVKTFFDQFFKGQITFPANQIDAVIGFFIKRGFEQEAARSTSIVLLNQSKIDGVNVFQLIDSLKTLTNIQLNSVVTQILNSYREKTSSLGYKILTVEETTESRNIRV
jgi:hypothetical protein